MKKLSWVCCMVLLLNLLCPVGHVHAEVVATPTDLCSHENWEWQHDDSYHWKYCPDCGETIGMRWEHVAWCVDSETTCADCGATNVDCYIRHADSDGYEYDENNHWTKCPLCQLTSSLNAHRVSCTAPSVCLDCGAAVAGDFEVVHDTEWKAIDTLWHAEVCKDCGVEFKREVHEYIGCDEDEKTCWLCKGENANIVHPVNYWQYEYLSDDYHKITCGQCGEEIKEGYSELAWERMYHVANCTAPNTCIYCGGTFSAFSTGQIEHEVDYDEYQYDETSHWRVCKACGEKEWESSHTAKCSSPDVCYECGATGVTIEDIDHGGKYGVDVSYEFADADSHWKICNECGEKVAEEHYVTCDDPNHCADCGASINDINVKEVYHGDTILSYDETNHYYVCSRCGEKTDVETHYSTCATPNICYTCGAEFEPTSATYIAHATYAEYHNEKYHNWKCSDCGEVIYIGYHVQDCTDDSGTCRDCGAPYSGSNVSHHTIYGVYESDETSHWETCIRCGEKCYVNEHYTNCGDTSGVCSECGASYAGGDVSHYVNNGYTEADETYHWAYCGGCGKKIEEKHYAWCGKPGVCSACDKEGDFEVKHYWDEDNPVIVEATDTTDGSKTYTCLYCGETKVEVIPATGSGAEPTAEPEATAVPSASPEATDAPSTEPEATAVPSASPEATDVPSTEPEATAVPSASPEATDVPSTKPEVTPQPELDYEPDETASPAPSEQPEATAAPEEETTTAPEEETTTAPTQQDSEAGHTHTYGAAVPTGTGAHSLTCTVCGEMVGGPCITTDAKIGNLDASACIYCGYITWALDNAFNGDQESKTVENAAFELVDGTAAKHLTLVVCESEPEVTILLDNGASVVVKKALTITLMEDGVPVQLTGTVKLSIPMEDDLTGLKLLTVDENGEPIEIEYEVIDGMMVFETSILGIFMLVEEI